MTSIPKSVSYLYQNQNNSVDIVLGNIRKNLETTLESIDNRVSGDFSKSESKMLQYVEDAKKMQLIQAERNLKTREYIKNQVEVSFVPLINIKV